MARLKKRKFGLESRLMSCMKHLWNRTNSYKCVSSTTAMSRAMARGKKQRCRRLGQLVRQLRHRGSGHDLFLTSGTPVCRRREEADCRTDSTYASQTAAGGKEESTVSEPQILPECLREGGRYTNAFRRCTVLWHASFRTKTVKEYTCSRCNKSYAE